MRRRSIVKFRPGLERFEARQLLSAGSLTTHVANTTDGSSSSALPTDVGRSHGRR